MRALVRAGALAALALAAWPGNAAAQDFRVVVVPRLDLDRIGDRGAVGLLVPGAGPKVNGATARAGLRRGKVENWLRGGTPSGPPLISLEAAHSRPAPPAIVVELPHGGEQPNDRRYPIAVLGRGYRGILTSESTRLPGLVSIADVAPTALGQEDALGWTGEADPVSHLEELDRRIRDHSSARLPAMLLTAGLITLLALVSGRAAVLAFATVLAANLVLGATAVTALWAVLIVFAAAIGLALPLARTLVSATALALALAASIGVYLVAFAVDETWVALSPLGPTQNARFYGLSNLLATLLLVPALAAAACLRRPLAFALVAALSFVTVAGTRFGADGGGAIVLAVGYAVLAVGVSAGRRRALAVALPVAVALALALVGIDAATGASSHVTDALEGGPDELFSDLADRIALSWHRATDSVARAVIIVVCIAGLALIVVGAARRRLEYPVLFAFTAAIATSLVVNDSPFEVALFGLVGGWALSRRPSGRKSRQTSLRNVGGSSTSWRMLPVRRA